MFSQALNPSKNCKPVKLVVECDVFGGKEAQGGWMWRKRRLRGMWRGRRR
jgi:hypothetical protein